MIETKRDETIMRKILLLEDDGTLGQGMRLALQGSELQIRCCDTLAQARTALVRERFDLLIH